MTFNLINLEGTMNIQDKSNEELIRELRKLQQNTSLKNLHKEISRLKQVEMSLIALNSLSQAFESKRWYSYS
jgi:hypothetical protein